MYSPNPNCFSPRHKIDKSDNCRGIENDKRTGRVRNPRQRSDLNRIDKECTHRIQIAFLPVTKLTKATTAAELRTTNVRAASATRDSGPILKPPSAARLNP